ncbi:MAG: endonuclease/exonuclease/phosphatase family protein [Pirellulaceae bacterium]
MNRLQHIAMRQVSLRPQCPNLSWLSLKLCWIAIAWASLDAAIPLNQQGLVAQIADASFANRSESSPATSIEETRTIPDSPLPARPNGTLRVMTYNTSLHGKRAGDLLEELERGSSRARQIAEVVQAVDADIVLLNEFDYDPQHQAVQLFQKKYLHAVPGGQPYSDWFVAAVNTGVPTGLDLNGNRSTTDAEDAFGFGQYPGQYGMAVFSRFPILRDQVRTFQMLPWSTMPGAMQPKTDDGKYYPEDVWRTLRLSSKSHWDIPIQTPQGVVHLLASHPTPPVFDGTEDRNGCRNHDEIRFWSDYLEGGTSADYIVDDQGRRGGLGEVDSFVLCGDLNADPADGDGVRSAIQKLLGHPRLARAGSPASEGAKAAAEEQRGINLKHTGDPSFDTADFQDRTSGNLRCDYVLPSLPWNIVAQGVFWPASSPKSAPWIERLKASDHRPVWVDLKSP